MPVVHYEPWRGITQHRMTVCGADTLVRSRDTRSHDPADVTCPDCMRLDEYARATWRGPRVSA